MKRLKSILTARRDKVKIHDPLEALIARMCDPTDILYNAEVALDQQRKHEDSEQR
jgi:hypothetical protein